eukprot:GILK01005361.1.p1 GENE.GILK01005361.1~~GILK01005361.1.p1  ORF type:complete len:305 (+),score=38.98 GILK01005361.1:35-949(+)
MLSLLLAFIASASAMVAFVDRVDAADRSYRAAIGQHRFADFGVTTSPLEQWQENVMMYIEMMRAVSGKADIIVFPEFGLTAPEVYQADNREGLLNYSINIPSLMSALTYCEQTESPSNWLLHRFSCAAKEFALVTAVNTNELVPCDRSSDPACRADGVYVYNTELVFDEHGVLIAKYHKKHVWFGNMYDSPVSTELVTFTTSFGVEFGVFICNDIRFPHPKDDLVQRGVKHFVFSVSMDTPVLKYIMKTIFIRSFSLIADATVLSSNGLKDGAVYKRGLELHTQIIDVRYRTESHQVLVAQVPY